MKIENVNIAKENIPKLPNNFDYIGASVNQMTMVQGNIIKYIDDGKKNWNVAVLIGGGGSSVEFFELVQFVRKLRKRGIGQLRNKND